MNDVSAERWEFSLLVDRANRILESRGQSEVYLAVPGKQLTGRHLVSFFDESERLGFLRYMARLTVRGEAEPVSATLRSTAMGLKRFSLAARKGDGRSNWWILFSQELRPDRQSLNAGQDTFASGEEFAAIIDARAPDQAPMDITVFRARALSEGTAPLTQAQQTALDETLGRSLVAHAHEHIVARPGLGEYALVHREDKPMADIERELVAVAARHNLTDLGLVRETRHLDGGVPAAQVVAELRQRLQRPGPVEAPLPEAPRRSWVPAVGVGIAFTLLIIAWFAFR